MGYRIYYGVGSGNFTNSAPVGAVTTATVTGLVVGTTYYFAATAFDTNGVESIFSNETTYTPAPAANQPPTLDALGNVTINEGAGQQTVNLSGISSGAANETQTLVVTASSSNPTLIPNPTVNYTSPNGTGTIRFTPAALASGTATVTVQVNDGGSSNNTVSRSFTVTVNPVNQSPTLDALVNVTINEGAGQQTVNLSGISSGAANETQTLVVTASSSNPTLIPNPTVSYTSPNGTGTIRFTPAALASGTATVTVQVNDGGSSNNTVTRSFTVTVNSVNQVPTLNALSDVTINEGAGQQTVNLAGISSGAANESQTLVVTAGSSDPTLIPNPTVTYTSPNSTGTIRFTPVALASGTATVTVQVNDGGLSNNVVTRSFAVTVNSVNQSPTLDALANVSLNEGDGLQTVNLSGISSGAANETQTLIVTASSSNPALIANPVVTYTSPNTTGKISFTPVAGTGGAATITVTVNDGAANNNTATRTFTVSVNRTPVIAAIADESITVGSVLPPISFTISDSETAANSLTLSAASDNQSLLRNADITFGGSGGNRTVTLTPLADQTGVAQITLTVSDGQTSAQRTFQFTVNPRPLPPGNLRVVQLLP